MIRREREREREGGRGHAQLLPHRAAAEQLCADRACACRSVPRAPLRSVSRETRRERGRGKERWRESERGTPAPSPRAAALLGFVYCRRHSAASACDWGPSHRSGGERGVKRSAALGAAWPAASHEFGRQLGPGQALSFAFPRRFESRKALLDSQGQGLDAFLQCLF